MSLIFESYWSTSNSSGLHGPPCFSICHVAGLRERQSQALNAIFSVVIRAAKLKFVAESRNRVYFVQYVTATCNPAFCCETSWSQMW